MPTSKKGKSGSRSRRRATKRAGPTVRGGNAGMSGAPVGVSEDIQQYTTFSTGRSKDGLRMRACAAICELNRISNSAPPGALNLPTGTGSAMSCQLNLTQPAELTNLGAKLNVEYTSPVFDLIASAFVRYKVNGLKFHYEPQSSATTTERLVFAFAEDPMHPLLWNTTVPSQAKLLALADSIAFAPWRSWTMDVSHRLADQTFYTFTDPGLTMSTSASFAERFSDFGVISCITSAFAGAEQPCGVLYMEIDVEFLEFCPISITMPASKHLALKYASKPGEDEDEYRAPAFAVSAARK